MYHPAIVADQFVVPEQLLTERMKLRPLCIEDVEKDYEAVMSSAQRLRTVFREDGDWPEGLTIKQNTIELGWHQVEFQSRTSFAYTVVSLDESQILGCMYIYPTTKADYDVEVTMWVRESEATSGLDEHLFETIERWVREHWPFINPVFPGRTLSWQKWNSL